MPPTIFEIIAALGKRYYAPRPEPTTIPLARWDDAPCKCLAVNDEWVSHIIGALDVLDQYDTWIGTEAEIDDARQQANEIMAALIGDQPMKCCCDSTTQIVLHRVSPDGTQMEVSYDNGATWQSDPNNLPFATPTMPAPVTSGVSATKCDAASNGLQHIKDLVANQSSNMATDNSVAALCIHIAVFLIGLLLALTTEGAAIPIVVPLIITVMEKVFEAGKVDFDAYWTSGVYDTILCALYCNIRADGTFDDAGFSAVISKLNAALPDSPHKRWLVQILSVMKTPGLNNLCAYGNSADADCSSCGCTCDQANWIWNTSAFGQPAANFTRDTVNNRITGDAVLLPNGHYYFGLEHVSGGCCVVGVDATGVQDEFKGVMACDYTGSWTYFDETTWTPIPIVINNPAKAILLRSSQAFSVQVNII